MNKMETRKKESQTQTQNFSQVFSQTLCVYKNTQLKHKKFEQRDSKKWMGFVHKNMYMKNINSNFRFNHQIGKKQA